MRRKKVHLTIIVFLIFTAVISAVYAWPFISRKPQERQVQPVQGTVIQGETWYEYGQVMQAAGYSVSQENPLSYTKGDPPVTVSMDTVTKTILKNQYVFDASNGLLQQSGTYYLNNTIISEFLNGTICDGVFTDDVLADDAWLTAEPSLFAHALGGIVTEEKTYTYTNSMDALVENYNKGFRLFEMDFMLSTDGTLLGLHSFKEYGGNAISSKKWKELKVKEKFQTMNLDDIYQEMMINQDMYLITDTKSFEYSDDCIQQIYDLLYEKALDYGGEALLKRVIPQIYSREEYALVKQVYDWPALIYTLYKEDDVPEDEIVDFVKEKKDIPLVTVPKRRVSAGFSEKLHQAGKQVYTHTIDDIDSIPEWFSKGVDGFYTNAMTIEEFSEKYGSEKLTIQKVEGNDYGTETKTGI